VTTGTAIPTGSATIYLVRHGRTALNAEGALRGHLNPPLDETGWREARAIAGVLAPLEPRRIVSSPLRRALETAHCIADGCGIDVDIGAKLVDRDYGQWAGRSPEHVSQEWGRIADAPGVESDDSVLRRAREALEATADSVQGAAAVVVAHDAINRALLASLDPSRFADAEVVPQRTGCFNVLRRSRAGWTVAEVDVYPNSGAEGG
jgi:broad specificity phosphatase PhoE